MYGTSGEIDFGFSREVVLTLCSLANMGQSYYTLTHLDTFYTPIQATLDPLRLSSQAGDRVWARSIKFIQSNHHNPTQPRGPSSCTPGYTDQYSEQARVEPSYPKGREQSYWYFDFTLWFI